MNLDGAVGEPMSQSLPILARFVNNFKEKCVSKVIMSPLTAKLKCPHGNGKHTHGAEAVTEVAFDQDGRR